MRISPKYFNLRGSLLSFSLIALAAATAFCCTATVYFTSEDQKEKDAIFWIMMIALGIMLVMGFLSYIAFMTYKERFWNGDKAVWKNSKWRFIKRFLNEPYSK